MAHQGDIARIFEIFETVKATCVACSYAASPFDYYREASIISLVRRRHVGVGHQQYRNAHVGAAASERRLYGEIVMWREGGMPINRP